MEILGIDIGGSGVKGAMVDTEAGAFIGDRLRIDTPQPATPDAVIDVVGQIVSHFDYSGPLGVGFPAIVLDGVTMSAANVDNGWIGYPGRDKIAAMTGCDVTMLNDADVAAIAEMRFGAGRGRDGMVMVFTLGTGIGSAMFINGHLVPNTELGHVYMPNQPPGQDAEDLAASSVRKAEGLSWSEWGDRLNAYFQHMERLFSPNLMIIGGGVSKKHEKFLHHIDVRAEVVPAQLRNQAGIVGAALAAIGIGT
ncbi:MAG: ROK family protein [Chloroflexota bacterium]